MPSIRCVAPCGSAIVSINLYTVVVAGADGTDLSVSENEAGNKPTETPTADWAADDTSDDTKDRCLGSSVEELNDSKDDRCDVQDKTELEPLDELCSDIRVPWRTCWGWGPRGRSCPAGTLIRVILPIVIEEVRKDDVNDEVTETLLARIFRRVLFFELHLGLCQVVKRF